MEEDHHHLENEGDVEAEGKALVAAVSSALQSRSLSSRKHAIEGIATQLYSQAYEAQGSTSVKPGPLKKIAKEVILALVAGPSLKIANRGEKVWPAVLKSFIASVVQEQISSRDVLPFDFVHYCAEVLIEKMKTTKNYEIDVLIQLSDTTSLLLSQLCDENGIVHKVDVETCRDLVGVMSAVLNSVSCLRGSCHSGSRDCNASESVMQQLIMRTSELLIEYPSLLPHFMNAWAGPLIGVSEGVSHLCLPGLSVLFQAAISFPVSKLAVTLNGMLPLRSVLLAITSMIISGGSVLPEAVSASQAKTAIVSASSIGALFCFSRVLSTVNSEEWLEVEALLLRQLKKNPETSAVLVATVYDRVSVPLDGLVREGLGLVIPRLLRSTSPEVRQAGLTLIHCATQRCSDSGSNSALVIVTLVLCEALHGKPITAGGRLPAAAGGGVLLTVDSQKLAMIQGLASCITVLNKFTGSQRGEGTQLVLETSVDSILGAIEKEKEPAVKYQEATLASKCILCHSTLPATAIAVIVKGLATKATAGPYLLVLNSLFSAPLSGNASEYANAIAGSGPLVNSLLKLFTDAHSKPQVASPEGVLALRVLLEVHAIANLAAATHTTLTNLLGKVLPTSATEAESTFLMNLALHSQLAGRLSSISSTNNCQLGHGAIEAMLAIVGIAHRDYATTVPLFVPYPRSSETCEGSKDNTDTVLGYGFGSTARKLIIFSMVSLCDHSSRKKVCDYWLPVLLRSCTAYSASQSCSREGGRYSGSLSLLDELNSQIRLGSENKERSRSSDLANFKGKDSGSGAAMTATLDSYSSLFVQSPSSRLKDALFYFLLPPMDGIAEVSDSISAQVFSVALLLAAHPMLSNDSLKRNTQIYNRLVTSYLRLPVNSTSLSDSVMQTLNQSVVSGIFAAQSSDANRRAGGQVALLLYDPHAVVPGELGRQIVLKVILPQLAEELHSDAIAQFTHEEVCVWKNPDYLVQEVERTLTTSAGIDDLKITNADRKKSSARGSRRGQFGSDFNEDDEWAEQLIKEKREKKLKSAHDAAQNSPEMTKALERTSDIRSRVGTIVRRCRAALDLLSFLATKYCDAFESMTIVLLTPLLELMRSPIVQQNAVNTTNALIGALVHRTPLEKIKQDIGLSLELVATVILRPTSSGLDNSDGVLKEVSERSGPVTRTLQVLYMLAAQASSISKNPSKSGVNVISTGCFQLIFPILRGVLSLRSQLSGGEHAFMILENLWKHVNRTSDSAAQCRSLLRYMLEATLGVAARSPRLMSSASEFLAFLLTVTLSPLEWTPLLGVTGLLCDDVSVRRLAVSSVMILAQQESAMGSTSLPKSRLMCNQPLVVSRIWLSSQDEDEEVKSTAKEVWSLTNMILPSSFMTPLLPLLENESSSDSLKLVAANALAAGIKVHPDLGADCLSTLNAIYIDALPQIPQSSIPLAVPKLSTESSIGSAKSSSSGGAADLSISAIRNSLTGSRNKVSTTKKAGAIDMAMIGMGAKKKPAAKKTGGLGVGIGVGIGAKPVTKKPVAKKEVVASVTEQISRIEKVVDDLKWSSRVVIANCYCSIGTGSAFSPESGNDFNRTTTLLNDAFHFLLTDGVTDPKEQVRAKMITAGRALIDEYGKEYCDVIVELLERTLAEQQPSDKQELTKFDLRHEATVILLGAAAKHLNKDDPNVKSIMESLVSSLSTPVESVQKAVADCLVPLVQARKTEDRVKELIEILMTQVVDGDSYGARRGAAFGLSAFVKGSGIPAIKNHDLVTRLKEFASSGSNNQRQGALFAFELLSDRLGMLFEPYVITIVPLLLKSFSHTSDHVREAAQLGAKTIMGRLSSHGVKQVLTPILQSLPTESQWKSRQEALRLLGSMAFCAPRQLASCLPQVIPRLVEAGSDPHPKVKEGAKSALADISSVIRNPEVSRLSPILLKALTDPATQTKAALEALLECEFMHSIDAPSLALLVPILARALKDRGGDLKRKSAVILGNMASMIADSKILSPYLPQVVPGLKEVLLDPIPDVRATSAKALGGLMLGMGEAELPDLVPWCVTSLSIETSPVERSGAAQGLAEICMALSEERVDEILEEALKLQFSYSSSSREGLLWLLAFLPAVMEEKFADHICNTLPVVLKGLSDNTEGVREVAMRSGQVFVSCHGRNHSDEVLPPLLTGMFDPDWRIRESSVTLLGELLYLIGEAKAVGLSSREADGGDIAEGGYLSSLSRVITTIREHVGQTMADNILSSLYIVRSDNSVSVRQCALQVWKSVVANTPRVLREIMPTLVQQIITMLSSSGDEGNSMDTFEPDFEDDEDLDEDEPTMEVVSKGAKSGASEQSTVAGRALGELVRKLGDHVLPLIIPYLQEGLTSTTDHLRQGVCLGLSEVLKAASAKQIIAYIDTLVPALQQAISDSSSHVRTLAAQAFHALARAIGTQAFDSVLPPLLSTIAQDYESQEAVSDEEISYALLGLEDIASHRPRDLLEYVIPILLDAPLQAWAANALGRLARCANRNIHHHYSTLIPQLIFELGTASFNIEQLDIAGESSEHEKARLESIKLCAGAVVGASTTAGINFLVGELGKQIEQAALEAHSSTVVVTSSTTISPIACRRWGCWLLGQFFVNANASGSSEDIADYGEYVPLFLKYLLARSADLDTETLKAIVEALKSLSKSVPVEILVGHIDFIRSCINLTASDAKHRVNKQDKERLYDSATGQFILPLFRIPKALESLFPIFIHALMNGSVDMRETAATSIGELAIMTETPLLKPYLIKTTGPLIRVVGDRFPSNVKFAILETLSILLQKGGVGLKAFVPQLQTTFVKSLSDPSKQVRSRASGCLGILVPMSTRLDPLLTELSLGVQGAESSAICVSFAEGISSVLKAAGSKASEEVLDKISRALLVTTVSEDEQVRSASAETLGTLSQLYTSSRQVSNLLLDLIPPGGGNSSLAASGEHWTSTAGRLISCGTVLQCSGDLGADIQDEVLDLFQSAFSDDRVSIRVAVCSAIAIMATTVPSVDNAAQEQLCVTILQRFGSTLASAATRTGLADDSLEVRRAAVSAMKQLAKNYQPQCANYAGVFAVALQPYVLPNAEINIRLKKSVERTLKYLLGIRHYQGVKSESCVVTGNASSATAAMQNISSTNGEAGRFMQEYARRVLSKLGEESDGADW